MIVEVGYWNLDTKVKRRDGFTYFVAKHRCNPTKVECVFVSSSGLYGLKELVKYINDEKLSVV